MTEKTARICVRTASFLLLLAGASEFQTLGYAPLQALLLARRWPPTLRNPFLTGAGADDPRCVRGRAGRSCGADPLGAFRGSITHGWNAGCGRVPASCSSSGAG